MDIFLTKKVRDACPKLVVTEPEGPVDPLFSWYADWVPFYQTRAKGDTMVFVNEAMRLVIVIPKVRKTSVRKALLMLQNRILELFKKFRLRPEVYDGYLKEGGTFSYHPNHSKLMTSRLNKQATDARYLYYTYTDDEFDYPVDFDLRVNQVLYHEGKMINRGSVFTPQELMEKKLQEHFGMPVQNYKAYELLITLDLKSYKAVRRVIVPADLPLDALSHVMKAIYAPTIMGGHLHQFALFKVAKGGREERRSAFYYGDPQIFAGGRYDKWAPEAEHTVSDLFQPHMHAYYNYDFGDDWLFRIEHVKTMPSYDKYSPERIEAEGQAPPQDVGGVDGYKEFLKAYNDPEHPQHKELVRWAEEARWSPELDFYDKMILALYPAHCLK
jgi:hypothetical protein